MVSLKELLDKYDSELMEIEEMRELVDRLRQSAQLGNDVIHSQVVAMKASAIAAEVNGPESGIEWLRSYLFGPGLLPTEEEIAMGPEAFRDKFSR